MKTQPTIAEIEEALAKLAFLIRNGYGFLKPLFKRLLYDLEQTKSLETSIDAFISNDQIDYQGKATQFSSTENTSIP